MRCFALIFCVRLSFFFAHELILVQQVCKYTVYVNIPQAINRGRAHYDVWESVVTLFQPDILCVRLQGGAACKSELLRKHTCPCLFLWKRIGRGYIPFQRRIGRSAELPMIAHPDKELAIGCRQQSPPQPTALYEPAFRDTLTISNVHKYDKYVWSNKYQMCKSWSRSAEKLSNLMLQGILAREKPLY